MHHAPEHRRRGGRGAARGRPRRQGPRGRAEPHPGAQHAPGQPRPPRRHQRRRGAGRRRGRRPVGARRRPRPARRSRAARGCGCRPAPAAPGPAQRRAPGDPQPGRRSGRSPTPTRPARCPRSRSSPAASSRPSGRRVAARSPRPTSSRGPSRRPSPTTSSSRRCASAGSPGDTHGLRRVRAALRRLRPRRCRRGRRGGGRRDPSGPGVVRLGDPGADGARPRPGPRGSEAAAPVPDERRRGSCARTSTRGRHPRRRRLPAHARRGAHPPGARRHPIARRGGRVSEPTARSRAAARHPDPGQRGGPVSRAPARRLLSDFLRHDLGLTGTHVGCEHGVCGACTVLVDGEPVRSCLMFAVTAQAHEVTTDRGHRPRPAADEPRAAGVRRVPGAPVRLLHTGVRHDHHGLPRGQPDPTPEEAREAISGNLCRCTGYQNIVTAVCRAAEIRRSEGRCGRAGRLRGRRGAP